MTRNVRPAPHLTMWTVYDHPADHPDVYFARKWMIADGVAVPLDTTFGDPDLDAVRAHLTSVRGMNVRFGRAEEDDPKIVETWM